MSTPSLTHLYSVLHIQGEYVTQVTRLLYFIVHRPPYNYMCCKSLSRLLNASFENDPKENPQKSSVIASVNLEKTPG